MQTLFKIIRIQLHDILRGKWVIAYTAIFFVLVDVLFRFGGDPGQVAVSLMNLVLFVVPLASIIFGTMFFYNSRDFIVLLLSQPISRSHLYLGLYTGISLPLSAVYMFGVGAPFLYHAGWQEMDWILILTGVMLTWIFIAMAFLIAVLNVQRVKGVGLAIMFWLFFAVLYDGIILFILFSFQDYPLEKVTIALSMLNPIDMARILMLVQFDIAALMGYTGALYSKIFGDAMGTILSFCALLLWLIGPAWIGFRAFSHKDF